MDDDKTLTYERAPSSLAEESMIPLPLSQRERHDTLWYKNGTIILATPQMLFRIYDGILCQHSPVFRDILSLPQSKPGSDEDSLNGVPVIQLHDDPTELGHFLSTLYDRSYYCHKDSTDFSTIAAILRLSNKYQIQFLRKQAISQLSTLYPSNIQNFDLIGPETLLVKNEDDVDLIQVGRETNALHLLPIAFYSIAISCLDMRAPTFSEMEAEEIVNYHKLSTTDIAKVFFGREKLRQALRTEIGKFLYHSSPSGCRNDGCKKVKTEFLVGETWIGWDVVPDILDLDVIISLKKGLSGLCSVCKEALHASAKEGRKNVWEKLPSYFGLADWETLKATSENIAEVS